MHTITQIARYVVGALFIFSGLIKLNDPVGTQIKLEEYFDVFAADFSLLAPLFLALIPFALYIAVILCVAEVVLGVALLVKYQPKITSWALLILIVFFTFLTFYSAYFNKVTDCGCFGDAIKLTPWQSFTKDVVLLLLILLLFTQRLQPDRPATDRRKMAAVAFSLVASLSIALYAISFLPVIDFLPYRQNASIPEQMKLPTGAQADVYETQYTLKNSRTGENRKMNDKEYLSTQIWKDTTWQIITTSEPRLVQRGDSPKITDFSVRNSEGDYTQQTFTGNKLLILIQNVGKTNVARVREINALVNSLQGANIEPMILTSADEPTFEVFRHELQLAVPYYFTDATVLKTMIRTDPGLIVLQNGVVKGKWPAASLPDAQTVKELLAGNGSKSAQSSAR